MKSIYLTITFFVFTINGFTQSKFTGEINFLSTTNNKITDSFQITIAKDYIEKRYTMSTNVLKFDDIVFINDSLKIYYINNDLRIVLWQHLNDNNIGDTTKYLETTTKKNIEGNLCTLFTKENKWDLLAGGQTLIHKKLWLTKDIIIDYGDKYYRNLEQLGYL